MEYKKSIQRIPQVEKKTTAFLVKLQKNSLIISKKNKYNDSDKQSFIILWEEAISCFIQLKKLLRNTKYRTLFFKIDYDKLVLQRYIAILYFNFLIDILEIFGKHESLIRQLLNDNYDKQSYGGYAKYIYKVKYINLLNTPQVFMDSAGFFITESTKRFLYPQIRIQTNKRIHLDGQNLYFYIRHKFEKILLYISKNMGALIAKIKFTTRDHGLITENSIGKYIDIAEPGDIILSRGNWNASNITIPGFWKHMALYIGTGEKIKKILTKQTGGSTPTIDSLKKKTHYIIEATGEGIKIRALKDFALHNDYLGFSRTSFGKEKINSTIIYAISNEGKEYDHLFNYHSDKNLVCSELVLKSYAPKDKTDKGIDFQLKKIGINFTFPPNSFIDVLKREKQNKHPQVFPVFFIDSKEKTGENFISAPKELFTTGSRPKLSLFVE